VVRYRSERKGRTFNHSVSTKFNNFINNNQLIDLKSQDRRFTWSNMRIIPSMTCLDRFLCTTSWECKFSNCLNKSLPRYQLDHNANILLTDNTSRTDKNLAIKYDKSWPRHEGFNEALLVWGQSYKLDILDLENS
jgi:hypothetical protein